METNFTFPLPSFDPISAATEYEILSGSDGHPVGGMVTQWDGWSLSGSDLVTKNKYFFFKNFLSKKLILKTDEID